MFGKIGMGELLLVLSIVLLIFGPSKLPALAKSMGQALREFRKGSQEVTSKIEKLADEPVETEPQKQETSAK
ncbi:Sec-independent protein translocase TatA [Hydrogenoanaerobacterium saccharovorans]|uniref:Sec-independent protein translocase protein TatA n=1 Tax=Hydrogenoanaerobacterium saccharovorans TaxID=474960 RepID=A0A1H8EID3_9FIRM|nr:twin-arginine translocase TatA/TatE family subunit [Hydrogenoanaerobacterium saccharovorans]RPF48754.1 Sec-independent protein translocase TatA [Hydrogenoanaerobacterium saccharovorans]SEN18637.1 Sec-independent protein translocase TatA [Hydrogenoanaerobacterium saccharovorans]